MALVPYTRAVFVSRGQLMLGLYAGGVVCEFMRNCYKTGMDVIDIYRDDKSRSYNRKDVNNRAWTAIKKDTFDNFVDSLFVPVRMLELVAWLGVVASHSRL